jgi:DNA-binding CsgD family transcriptional regulator
LDRYIIRAKLNETVHNPLKQRNPVYGDTELDDVHLLFTDEDDVVGDNVLYTTVNVEDDEFTLLRQVEEKIKELVDKGQISELELEVLRMLSIGNTYKEVAKKLGISRDSARKNFNTSCNKLAFSLGGVFTDEGYAEYMAEKYSLTDQQVDVMMELLESNRRL